MVGLGAWKGSCARNSLIRTSSGRSVWHELDDVMDGFISNLLVNCRLRFKEMKWIINNNGKELQFG
jgi:hypothetical protein